MVGVFRVRNDTHAATGRGMSWTMMSRLRPSLASLERLTDPNFA